MKDYKILICVFFLVGFSTFTNAQIWKKLKQKVENKLDKETDKIIDKVLEGKEKKEKQVSNKGNSFQSYGSASISHSTLYGMFSVNDLGQAKVKKKGNKVSITGAWRTSDADIFDGYILKINGIDNINTLQNKTFKIPEEASFELAYNALVKGTYSYKQGQVHAPQKVSLSDGQATIKFHKDNNLAITFSGKVQLSDYNKGNTSIHDVPATINGMITTNSPQYSVVKDLKNSTQQSKEKKSEISKPISHTISPTLKIPDLFTFNKSIELLFTDQRGESYPMEFLIGNYPDIWGMSVASKEMQGQGNVTMVITPKSSTAFMNVAGMKIKRSTSLEQMGNQFNMSDKLPENADFEYNKTGKSKTILGYNCQEYRVDYNYTNAKGSAVFWVSDDFPVQNKELPILGMKMNNPNFSGFVLELSSTHQGQHYVIKVTKVSDKNVSINTSAYKNMGY